MENNQGTKMQKVYIAIIVVLLLFNLAEVYLLFSDNRAKNDLMTQKTALQAQATSLNDTLDAKKAELEQFRGKSVELDSLVSADEAQIDKQKKQISGLFAKGKMTSTQLAKAKEMISQYEGSIAELQKKVDDLSQQNKQLTNQNQQLSTDLSSEKKTSAELSEQNKGLSKKAELGSLLNLSNITVEGIAKKKNGKEVVEKKAKKVESLRISFETGDNKVLEAGQVSLYVRIINPKGETISVADQGSGTLKLAATGETLQYTKEAPFDWAQTNKKIVLYWGQNVKDPGLYKVEIYQSGYMQGSGSVELK